MQKAQHNSFPRCKRGHPRRMGLRHTSRIERQFIQNLTFGPQMTFGDSLNGTAEVLGEVVIADESPDPKQKEAAEVFIRNSPSNNKNSGVGKGRLQRLQEFCFQSRGRSHVNHERTAGDTFRAVRRRSVSS